MSNSPRYKRQGSECEEVAASEVYVAVNMGNPPAAQEEDEPDREGPPEFARYHLATNGLKAAGKGAGAAAQSDERVLFIGASTGR